MYKTPLTWRINRSPSALSMVVLCSASLLVLAATGCSGTGGQPTEAELQAITAIRQAGGRVAMKKGRVHRIDLSGRVVEAAVFQLVKECAAAEMLLLRGATFDESDLAALVGLEDLMRLSLKQTELTDASLEFIGKLTKLEELDLELTQVSDAGLKKLSGLKKLKKLYLSGTEATFTGAAELKTQLPRLKVFGT